MGVIGRQSAEPAVTATLRDAGFVRLAPEATGDAVAAAGVLARALRATGTPFQIGIVTRPEETRTTEADLVVTLGRATPDADATLGEEGPASVVAFDIASSLVGDAIAPTLAGAGVLAGGDTPAGPLAEALAEMDVTPRPGVATPTADLADGLAHSTLLHGPFSGDPDAAETVIERARAGSTDDEARRVASLVALQTVEATDAVPRAAEALEPALRPYAGGPLETLEGYADVLAATVRDDPGTAVALALGHEDATDDALDAWRRHAMAAHEALRETTIRRHAGVVVASATPTETVARLLRDFRSPEPLALVDGDGRVALAAMDAIDAESVLETAMANADASGQVTGTTTLATSPFQGALEDLVDAVREVAQNE